MDINSILNNDGYHIKNPYYREGNGQPEYLIGENPTSNIRTTADLFMEAAQRGDLGVIGEEKDYRKYIREGITPSKFEDTLQYDKFLADRQSNWSKLFNSLGQTVVSEIGLGTLGAFADIFDFVASNILGIGEANYSNKLGDSISELQEKFREEIMPIYTDPTLNIQNGGLKDIGWWMKGLPSVASSLTLLIPARGISAGIGALGKLARVDRLATKAKKWAGAAKTLEKNKELNALQRALHNPLTKEQVKLGVRNSFDAILMRTMENYQESSDVHKQTYDTAFEQFSKMSDEEFAEWVANNGGNLDEDVDKTSRDSVAKAIAKQAADRTFAMDFSNVIFDIIQLHGLRNIGKGAKEITSRNASAAIKAEQKMSVAAAAEIGGEAGAIEKATLTGFEKFKNNAKSFIRHNGKIALEESTEGIEEAVNYIAQQEGLTYGKALLDGKGDDYRVTNIPMIANIAMLGIPGIANVISTWNNLQNPLSDYLKNAELQESAFWGFFGGMAFGVGGSVANRVRLAKERRDLEKELESINDKTGEKLNLNDKQKRLFELFELPEEKAARIAIADRKTHLTDLKATIDEIRNGYDVYAEPDETGAVPKTLNTAEAQEVAIDRAIREYQQQMVLDAINSGTYDLLLDYWKSDGSKKALKTILSQGENEEVSDAEIESNVNDFAKQAEHIKELHNRVSEKVIAQVEYINATSKKEPISLRYAQVIANKKLNRILDLEKIDAQIAAIDEGIAEKELLEVQLDPEYNNKKVEEQQKIRLRHLVDLYSILETQKKEIEDEKYKDWNSVRQLKNIEEQQKILIDELKNTTILGTTNFAGESAIAAAIMRASTMRRTVLPNGISDYVYDNAISPKTDEQIIKTVEQLLNKPIDNKDVVLNQARIFANNTKYKRDDRDELKNRNYSLWEKYHKREALTLSRSMIAREASTDRDVILSDVDLLHNQLNTARKKIIEDAGNTIMSLVKEFSNEETGTEFFIRDFIVPAYEGKFEDVKDSLLSLVSEERANKVISALKVINFSNAANQNIYDYLVKLVRVAQQVKLQSEESPVPPEPEEEAEGEVEERNEAETESGNENENETESPIQEQPNQQETQPQPKPQPQQESRQVGQQEPQQQESSLGSTGPITQLQANSFAILDEGQMGIPTIDVAPEFNTILHKAVRQLFALEFGEDALTKETLKEKLPTFKEEVKQNILSTNKEISEEELNKVIDDITRIFYDAAELIEQSNNPVTRQAYIMTAFANASKGDEYETPEYLNLFAKAVDDFFEEYGKIVFVGKSKNGKQIVNMQDVLTICNRLHSSVSDGMASTLYDMIFRYVTSPEGSRKYILDDLGKGKTRILRESGLTDEEIRELNYGTEGSSERVDIYSQIQMFNGNQESAESKAFFKILDAIKVGDELDVDVDLNKARIVFKKDNVTVGFMNFPRVIGQRYIVANNGWVNDLELAGNNVIKSTCKDTILSILLGNTQNNKDIIKLIEQYDFSKNVKDYKADPTKNPNHDIFTKFANNPIIQSLIQSEISKRALFLQNHKRGEYDPNAILYINDETGKPDIDRMFDFLARLYQYSIINAKGLDVEANKKNIELNIDFWFNSRYKTYDRIANFAKNYTGQKVTVKVTKVNDGQITKVYEESENEKGSAVFKHYNETNYPKDVIVDRSKSRLTFISNEGVAITSGFGPYSTLGWSRGNTLLTTFDRNGHPHHVRAIGALIDDNLSTEARDILKAVNNAIFTQVHKLCDEPGSVNAKEELKKVLRNAFVTKENNYGLIRGLGHQIIIGDLPDSDKGNGYDGVAITYINQLGGTSCIKFYTKTQAGNGFGISYITKEVSGVKDKKVKLDGVNSIIQIGKKDAATGDNITKADINRALKIALSNLYKSSQINISSSGLQSDNTNGSLLGFFKRTKNGVELNIPLENGSIFHREAASYNDLLIDNNLVRVNLQQVNGKNFTRRGSNQQQNQLLCVSLPDLSSDSSSISQSNTSRNNNDRDVVEITAIREVRDNIKSALERNKTNIGEQLFDIVLGDGKLQEFIDNCSSPEEANMILDAILPKNVTYVPELNWYDRLGGKILGVNAATRGARKGNPSVQAYNDDGTQTSRRIKSNEVVLIGPKLLNKLSHIDIKQRKEGMRKLIHEQLHTTFQQDIPRYKELIKVAKEIYDITYAKLEEQIKVGDQHAKTVKKIFDNTIKGAYSNNNTLYEEFLVETLTNPVFANYLNSIEVENEEKTKKESLFTRIMKAIAKFFGWEIKDDTLLAKEFNMLADIVGDTTPVEDNNTKQVSEDEFIETVEGEIGDDVTANQVPVSHTKEFDETSSKIDEYLDWSDKHTDRDKDHIYYYKENDNTPAQPIDMSVTQYYEMLHPSKEPDRDWSIASNIGNRIDEITRDFYANGEKYVRSTSYPNINTKRKNLIISELKRFTKYLNKTYPKGYKVITKEFTLLGKANTVNGVKTIAGTMDMLVIDNEGNLHVYDMKAKRNAEMSEEDRNKYTFQLNVYRQMLENTFPEFKGKIKDHHLIWFDQEYPEPGNKVKYEINDETNEITVIDLSSNDTTPLYKFKQWITPTFQENIDKSIKELQYKDELQNLSKFLDDKPNDDNENTDLDFDMNVDDVEIEDEGEGNYSQGDEYLEYEQPDNATSYENAYSSELQQIKEQAIANGTFMKAPNGKPTNLNERQWLQVRTKAFKDWFGDWENDADNASKVVDENGEPLVVYHGSYDTFNIFDASKKRYNVHDKGFFFTTAENKALKYGPNVIAAFLNIKNIGYSEYKKEDTIDKLRDRENIILNDSSYDGVKFKTIDKEGFGTIQYAVYNPNQIKSATDNIGTFSKENNNINYSQGDEVDFDNSYTQILNFDSFKNKLPANLRARFTNLINNGEIEEICR